MNGLTSRVALAAGAAALVLAGCVGRSPSTPPPGSRLTVVAGVPDGAGNLDGAGADARFANPNALAVDGAGNVYVADSGNHTIRKVTAAGVVTTLAGTAGQSGSADGTGAAARFNQPLGVAVDGAGNLYVTDAGNHTIRKVTPEGVVTTLAGTAGQSGSADGAGAAARFDVPRGVAMDEAGNVLYVAEYVNHTIRKVTPGGAVTTLAGSAGVSGSADGTGAAARFSSPTGLAVDGGGNVFVADAGNCTVRRVTAAGVVTTFAGMAGQPGSADGAAASASFRLLRSVAVDGAGTVYVADAWNHTIRRIRAGAVSTLAGTAGQLGGTDGAGAAARFHYPYGVAVDGSGNVYVADFGSSAIRKVTPAGVVTTFAGTARQPGSADGAAATARFFDPDGVAADGTGNLYVADAGNHTIRKVTAAGEVTTLAGSAGASGSADGSGAAARFDSPRGVTVDGAGNLYVTDSGNHTIRKVTPEGVVTTIAGTAGQLGSADGTGAAARFETPWGVAVNDAGDVLYVADWGNHTLRKVTLARVVAVTTLAGSAGVSGGADGAGADARFSSPAGVAVDGAGDVYVADTGNHAIRKVTAAGEVTTLAGSAGASGSGDGSGAAARFDSPRGVAVDGSGDVYVADSNNHAIRRVTPAGVVSTVIGTPPRVGTVAGPLPASLSSPRGVAIDPATGHLLIVLRDAVLDASL